MGFVSFSCASSSKGVWVKRMMLIESRLTPPESQKGNITAGSWE